MTSVRLRGLDVITRNPGEMTKLCISCIELTAFCEGALSVSMRAQTTVYFTTMILAPTRHKAQATLSERRQEKVPTFPTNESRSFRNMLDPMALLLDLLET